jgi:hypothetical protein
MSQTTAILSHLKHRGAISPQTALREYGCMRLAARARELREMGYPVLTEMVETKTRGRIVRHAVYRLGN